MHSRSILFNRKSYMQLYYLLFICSFITRFSFINFMCYIYMSRTFHWEATYDRMALANARREPL